MGRKGYKDRALGPTAEATREYVAAIRRIMVARRILLGKMKNVLATNTGKYAAWISASHIEKAPQKSDPTP